MSKKEAVEKTAVVKNVPLHAPKSVKISCASDKRNMRVLAEAHASFEAYRKSGFKGSWWNKSEGRAEKAEKAARIPTGNLIKTGRALSKA